MTKPNTNLKEQREALPKTRITSTESQNLINIFFPAVNDFNVDIHRPWEKPLDIKPLVYLFLMTKMLS